MAFAPALAIAEGERELRLATCTEHAVDLLAAGIRRFGFLHAVMLEHVEPSCGAMEHVDLVAKGAQWT